MPAGLKFYSAYTDSSTNTPVSGTNADVDSVKFIAYEDVSRNQYIFGVNNSTNVFEAFKYTPSSGSEVDYSPIATQFMTGGGVATLLSTLGAIETAVDVTNLGNKLRAIQDKTDNLDLTDTSTAGKLGKVLKDIQDKTVDVSALAKSSELTPLTTATGKIAGIETNVGDIKTATNPANLGDKLTAIQAKTNTIPADFGTKVDALAKSSELTPLTTAAGKIAGIETNVGEIKTKTNKLDPTDTNTGALGEALGKLAAANKLTELDTKVDGIKDKTDTIPADFDNKVNTLAKSAELTPLAKSSELTPLATAANLLTLDGKVNGIATQVGNTPLATVQSVTDLTSQIRSGSTNGKELKTALTTLNDTLGIRV
jgi:hypothetical protein